MRRQEEITEAITATKVRVTFTYATHTGADHWRRFFHRAMELAQLARERAATMTDDTWASATPMAGLA